MELNGRQDYLGKHDALATKQRYHRLVAEWLANGGRAMPAAEGIILVELADLYMEFSKRR